MKSYSSGLQDVFALFANNNKIGYVVDIGCKDLNGNNSLLLLENGWSGVGADITDYKSVWDSVSNFKFYNIDVTSKIDIDTLFESCPNIIDFLSIDVDGAGLSCLKNINFDKFKFKSICIEHDYYVHGNALREPQRKILEDRSYTRVIQTAAEDWYVKMDLLDDNVIDIIKNIPNHHEIVGHEMGLIIDWLKIS